MLGEESAGEVDQVRDDPIGAIRPKVGEFKTVAAFFSAGYRARLLIINPWDKTSIADIEKAIMKSDLGITPNSDGNVIRLNIPQLTEERRKDLAKVVRKRAEEGKVAIRNIRREANDLIKSSEKDKLISEDAGKKGLDDIQKITDRFIKDIDQILQQKEKEIMEV